MKNDIIHSRYAIINKIPNNSTRVITMQICCFYIRKYEFNKSL